MRTPIWTAALLSLVVWGCQPATTPEVKKDDKPKMTPTSERTGGPMAVGGPAAPEANPADVPANVKTAAFQYLALDQAQSMPFELTGSPAGLQTGGIETKLIEVKDGKAKYRQSWTGGLSYIGDTELVAQTDGVYSVSAAGKPVDPPQMELPADPQAGKSWKAASKVEIAGATVKSSEVKILGNKKVKTKAGDFDALAVQAQVTGTRDGKDLKVTMTAYYVKGKGPVRIEMNGPGPDGKPFNTVLQATKP